MVRHVYKDEGRRRERHRRLRSRSRVGDTNDEEKCIYSRMWIPEMNLVVHLVTQQAFELVGSPFL